MSVDTVLEIGDVCERFNHVSSAKREGGGFYLALSFWPGTLTLPVSLRLILFLTGDARDSLMSVDVFLGELTASPVRPLEMVDLSCMGSLLYVSLASC